MVEFGKTLAEAKRSDWREQYLDYDRLKHILKQSQRSQQRITQRASHSQFLIQATTQTKQQQQQQQQQQQIPESHWLALEFRHALDQEIEKVVLFLLKQQGKMAQELSRLAVQRTTCIEQTSVLLQEYYRNSSRTSSGSSGGPSVAAVVEVEVEVEETSLQSTLRLLEEIHRDYQKICHSVLAFVAFVELNVTAVRKILKKHDKNHPQHKLSQSYLSTLFLNQEGGSATSTTRGGGLRDGSGPSGASSSIGDGGGGGGGGGDTHLDQLYNYGGLSALVATLKRAFAELHQLELNWIMMQQASSHHRRARSAPDFLLASDPSILSRNETPSFNVQESLPVDFLADNIMISPPSSRVHNANLALETRPPAHIVTTITTIPEPLLHQIYAARSRLKQSTKYVQIVAAQAMMFDDDDDDDDDAVNAGRSTMTSKGARLSSFLNLLSTFLYMTNYYIVAPTTGQYALKVGSTEAMAGIIIGMTPNAALIATVLYGWWSNHSYKSALIFAAGSSMMGNICYALALHYHSLTLVMVGRFLNGFGSARSINRRFIADTFSRADRTSASAAFVTAGALGMAAGPAIAAILGHFHQDRSDVHVDGGDEDMDVYGATSSSGSLLWTVETSPGWIMLGLWSIFFVSAIFGFEEPDRSHLYVNTDKPTPQSVELYTDATTVTATATATSSSADADTNGSSSSEVQPLLLVNGNGHNKSNKSYGDDAEKSQMILLSPTVPSHPPLYHNVPVMMTLWIYFILKLVLECLLSSCATSVNYYFGWNAQHTGTFLAFLGLLMFPANMVVAKLSHRYEDRELLMTTLVMLLVSVLGIISYWPDHYTAWQYMIGSICVFLSANILEGPNMSLLSKTIPKHWAKGTFNSGFLATEAGTLARSVGDVLISGAAVWMGMDNLLNATFVPLIAMVLVSVLLMRHFFDRMVEEDEDDDSSISVRKTASNSSIQSITGGTTSRQSSSFDDDN